ncbi:MAG TPA: hypothetical protein VMV93_10145 [Chloroflexota bacterium]|nr:hypothetical protein [Chloroflexota bacterium]
MAAGKGTSATVHKEARERAIQILALASTIIWLAGMFWIMWTVRDVNVYRIGGEWSVLFIVPAALPWLAYPSLVRREEARRSTDH